MIIQYSDFSVEAWQMRGGLIDLISRKSFSLSARARVNITNGHLNNALSSDCSYVEQSVGPTIDYLLGPLTIVAATIALCIFLGPTALIVSFGKRPSKT